MRIISWEQYCENKGLDPVAILPDVSSYPEKHHAAIIATAKMYLIAEEINDGHVFDWNDDEEEKWTPWFDMEVDNNNPSGFRFYDAYCVVAGTCSPGGSRLCYRTSQDARYAAETFIDLYRDMMVVPK